jgi:hypothetical protein
MIDDAISLQEALELFVKHGMSRRAAKQLLMQSLANGSLQATAIVVKDGMMLGRQDIPPEYFEGLEGD